VVFDYFEGRGIGDPIKADDETLSGLLIGLIWGHARTERFKIDAQEDPRRANLKRRIREAIASADYRMERTAQECLEYVSLAARGELRLNAPILSVGALQRLAEIAYLDSRNLSQCCARVFAELNAMTEVQNRLRKHELVSAVVAVVLRYIETDGFSAARPSTPESDFDEVDMQKAREAAVKHVRERVIGDFVSKERITSGVGDRFANAAEQYLLDFCVHGNADPIPQYFRENMPEEEHEQYLNKYKYVFETVINSAVEEFRSRLRD